MKPDYLIVGSGLSALVFGALMANSGKTVQILGAHEHPGGFGHTFTTAKKYTFNAQFHYVWDCGEGQLVNRVLKKLGLDQDVTFEQYDPNGFDHMRMPGHALDIPSEPEELIQRLTILLPAHGDRIRQFVNEVEKTGAGLKRLAPPVKPIELLKHPGEVVCAAQHLNSTLQDVFDKFQLTQAAQTLLALQWLDFLLPPNQLSFYAWVALFRGYQAGAFYPTQHFEHVINSLVKVIESHGGQLLLNQKVTNFRVIEKTVMGFEAMDLTTHQTHEFTGDAVYDDHGIQQPSEFDFFQTGGDWGYNGCLNQLCGISSPQDYFLSFQLEELIAKEQIIHIQKHHTPLYATESFRYRDEVVATNGENNTYHAGAYLGDGLHEGAITSAFRVAQLIS